MGGKRLRIAAVVVAQGYLGVRAFRDYVFEVLPRSAVPAEELVVGGHPLHVVGSTLLLLSMFGLVFLFGVIALQRARARPILAGAAFLSFLVYGLFEIGVRSTELFWTQIRLPAAYAASHDPAIVDQLITFQEVQGALYFPPLFSTLIGSILMVVLFAAPPRIHWIIRIAFAWNAVIIAARILSAYGGIPIVPWWLYEQIHFPLVVFTFYVPAAYWLVKVPDEPRLRPAST